MVTMVEGGSDGARLRAAVDRLHVAQLAALAGPEACHLGGPDAYSAERRLLEHVAEIGSLLARLGRPDVEGAGAVRLRQRLVSVAVASSNTLAELVGLAFELEAAGGEAGEAGAMPAAATAARRGGRPLNGGAVLPGSAKAAVPGHAPSSYRAVTDTNRLLVDQLRRLMQHAQRRESWRSTRPGELWRGLLMQVAELYPVAAALEAGALSEAEAKELSRLTADAANYLAFLRCFPRAPTA
jgi:hypothetical protein